MNTHSAQRSGQIEVFRVLKRLPFVELGSAAVEAHPPYRSELPLQSCVQPLHGLAVAALSAGRNVWRRWHGGRLLSCIHARSLVYTRAAGGSCIHANGGRP